MATVIERPDALGAAGLADDLASLAAHVRASVVLVRAPRGGSGSGVLWNDGGLIVTNHHVAAQPWAEVEANGGARFPARVVARDPSVDLAALAVTGDLAAHGLRPATVGDATRLRVGELVIAVGNPLGERSVVTMGIVSAPLAVGDGGRGEIIRAAITLRPGNSGGALADARGRVVGIPHMVVRPGLALAVPSHIVQRFLHAAGLTSPAFGVGGRLVTLPPALAAAWPGVASAGFLVLRVTPGSVAEATGVIPGDISVVAEADAPADPLAQLRDAAAGRHDRLAILRGGALRWLTVLPRAA
jgi:serine protease Do